MGNPVKTLEQNADLSVSADDEEARHSNVVPSTRGEQRATVRVPAFAAPLESEIQIRHAEAADADAILIDEGWTSAEAAPSLRPSARPTFRPSVRPTLRVPEAASAGSRKVDASSLRLEGGYSQIVRRRRST